MRPCLPCIALLTFPLMATAQTRVDLTPFIGAYFPLSSAVNESNGSLTQAFSAALGVRLAIWGSKLGVELGGAYAKSSVSNDFNTFNTSVPGRVTVGSLRLLYSLTQGTARCLSTVNGCQPAIYVSGGLGFITRGGQAWQGISGTTNLTGSAGAGLRIPVSRKVTARVDVEFLLYPASFSSSTSGPTSSQFQEDVVLSAGLWIPLAGAR